MAKTKYQEAAMEYAQEYLSKVLELETVVGKNMEEKIDKIVEKKVQQILAERDKAKATDAKEMKNEEWKWINLVFQLHKAKIER